MNFLKIASQYLLDIIYPPYCISCSASGRWWCEACRVSVERPAYHPCPRCLSVDHRELCDGPLPFDGVIVLGFYHSKPLRRLITELKYGGVTSLNREVECFFLDRAASYEWEFPWGEVAPKQIQSVPLASARLRDRGLNQSHTIAERIREAWLPHAVMIDAIDRLPSGVTQASIHDRKARQANVKNIFVAEHRIQGSVLLVDDVVTTGATAADAARCLKNAGATSVYLAAVAIGK